MPRLGFFIALIALSALWASAADAKRVALVVGINAYDNLNAEQQLRKAVNDSRAIAATLKDVGFQVIAAEDATRTSFLRSWQRFLDTVKPGDVTAVFFAGHGIELNGTNFLLPRDVPRPDDGEEVMRGSAIRVGSLMERLREQGPQVAVWIIDACRDNPYAGRGTRSVGSTRGLKREEPPKGTLVMMSAGTGQGALDALSPTDNNPNSVYTRTLLPLLKEPGLEVTDLAKRVRSQVETLASSIQFDQRPAFYHELSGDFYLSESRAAPAVAAGPTGLSEAAQAWSSAKDSSDPALLKAYIQQFGGTFYAGLAQARLDEVEKSRRGQPGVTAPVSPFPVASATRPSQPAAAMPPAVKPPTAMESAQAWIAIQNSKDGSAFEQFLGRHGDSIYAGMAREHLEAIRRDRSQVAAVTGPGTTRGEPQQMATSPAPSGPHVAAVVPPAPLPPTPNRADPAVGVYPRTSAQPLSPAQERALKPQDTFEECPNCPQMIVVPSGSFTMGSPESETGRRANEGPQRTISIAKAFAVGRFAVTFDQWEACVAGGGCNGYMPADEGGRRGRHPVVNVSWEDAKAYVAWLSNTTGKPYRLLSEAEREYVTRAGTTSSFWFGTTISSKQANYDGSIAYGAGKKSEFRERLFPVDFFAPNAFGLYQVHGNVADWTEDCWRPSLVDAPADGSARTQTECGGRTLRGGSFTDGPNALRAAARNGFAPGNRAKGVGFRVARSL